MKVVIVGAGIAGLTLVHELRRRGLEDVVVLEKVEHFAHVGAGIHIGSWGATLMDANGTGALARQLGTPYRARRYLDRHGRTVGRVNHEDIARRHGGVIGFFLHRADLHQALLAGGGPRELHLGVHLEAIEDTGSSLRLQTQHHGPFEADLVVGCDGLHSAVRTLAFPQRPHPIGKHVIRVVAEADPTLTEFEVYRGIGSSIGLTPLNDRQLYLWCNLRQDPVEADQGAAGRAEHLRQALADYPAPRIQGLLERMDPQLSTLESDVYEVSGDPWWRGRVVLCGDAAHAMAPSTGSGGTMAIEDAFVLARELASVASGDIDLDAALDAYYRQRLPRVEAMRTRTRLATYNNNLPTEELCRLRDERDRLLLADPDAHAFEVTEALDPGA